MIYEILTGEKFSFPTPEEARVSSDDSINHAMKLFLQAHK